MLWVNKRREGWCYHSNHGELRGVFKAAFSESMGSSLSEGVATRIDDAKMIGLFLEHAFDVDGDGNRVPARDGAEVLVYLDRVLAVS